MAKILLKGSERTALPGARVLGPANPAERLEVTVLVRRRSAQAFQARVSDLAAGRGKPSLSREEFAREHGADPADFAKVRARTTGPALECRMDPNWNDSQPIYRQLRDRMVALILEGALKEGDPLPSVRTVAADYRLNPLTVLKGYQQLVDEGLVEKRRGRGMYVSEGARQLLLAGERERFLKEEWPRVLAVILRLGFTAEELFAQTPESTHPAPRADDKK
jgi:GntR family transcriptional regulator